MHRSTRLLACFAITGCATFSSVHAQPPLLGPRLIAAPTDRLATLEDQLVSRLRVTNDQQLAYLRFVLDQVRDGHLDTKLILALERYAIRRNSQLPFLFFERALRFEAGRRGIILPSVRQFATTVAMPHRSFQVR